MFLGYQCAKVCEAFLIFQIFSLLRALNLRISANIQFANFKIDFLGNQSEYRKSLTLFCSVRLFFVLIDIVLFVSSFVRAGRQVIQFSK